MKKEKSVHLTADGILVIDGKEYVESIVKQKDIDGIKHIDKQLYCEFDRKGYEEKMDFIVEKIEDSLDKTEIIKELIKKRALNEIDNLYKTLREGEPKKKITKQEGCIGLKIGTGKPKTGGAYLQLVD